MVDEQGTETGAAEWSELPPQVRRFLAGLREEEVTMLRDGLRLLAAISTVGRVARWLLILGAGLIITLGGVGDALIRMWHWVVPPAGPK